MSEVESGKGAANEPAHEPGDGVTHPESADSARPAPDARISAETAAQRGEAGDADTELTETEFDPASDPLTKLLTDLANDPEAPTSSVTAASVIAAARAAAPAVGGSGDGLAGSAAAVGSPAAEDTPAEPALAQPIDIRRNRRRTGLIALVAAAAVAGIAAVVIPLSLSAGSSTSTSADAGAARSNSAGAGSAESDAALAAGSTGAQSQAAEAFGAASGAGSAPTDSAGGPAAAAPQTDAGTGAETTTAASPEAAPTTRPEPGPDAITQLVPEPTAPSGPSCWPALSDQAAAALAGALPADKFGSPGQLDLGCSASPVAGALLPGTTPGTVLVVRVSKADPGACARGDSEAGVRCVPQADGVYVTTDGSGSPTAYAYGNGNEVVVGGELAGAGVPPRTTGLTAEQLIAAAQAVLGAVG